MNIFTALISLLLSTSLYPAATPPRSYDSADASAAAAPAAEVKRAAASREFQSKAESHEQSAEPFDGELDTAQSRLRRTPPTDAELKQARERAQKCNSKFAILLALAQPYSTKDQHVFALELFKQWHALCERKRLLNMPTNFGSAIDICDEIRSMTKEERDQVPLIVWCCMGILLPYNAHVGIYRPGEAYAFASEMQRNEPSTAWYPAYMIYKEARYETIEASDKRYQDAQINAPLVKRAIQNLTDLPPEIAAIVERYARQERRRVVDVPDALEVDGCMIGSLEGLSECTDASIDLRFNIITHIGRRDLPQGSILRSLQLLGNPLHCIAPYAFICQTALNELRLQECQLTRITRSMFVGLKNLQQLFLNANPIAQIDQGALSQLSSLTGLSLRHCALRTVPEDLQTLVSQGKLTELDFDGNPLEKDSHQNEIKNKLLELVTANAAEADKKNEQQQ